MKYTEDVIKEAVNQSNSFIEVLRNLGITKSHGGGTYYHIREKIKRFGIDTSHFTRRRSDANKRKQHWSYYLTISKIRIRSYFLRRALIEAGVEYKCVKCNNNGIWFDCKLRLEVDHINGDCLDNRKDNLQFLCPNCHSTKTLSKDNG